MKIIRYNILLIAILLLTAISEVIGQDIKGTRQYLQKQFEIYMVHNNPYDSDKIQAKGEFVFLEVQISKIGKIDTICIINELEDSLFKKSLENSLSKLKKSFSYSKANAGTYPVLISFLYGDDESTFRNRSVSWLMNLLQTKYRSFEPEPIVVLTWTSFPRIK